MKLFSLIVFCSVAALSGQAFAQTPIPDEMAQKYYQSCLSNSQKEGTMTKQSQDSFCRCTSKLMQQTMVVEDLVAMQGQDQAARDAINKILTDVNGPCMQYPVHDKVYKKCMSDVGKRGTCECLSGGIADYLSQQSQTLMRDLLNKNPNIIDPMGEIMSLPDYQKTERALALQCLTSG